MTTPFFSGLRGPLISLVILVLSGCATDHYMNYINSLDQAHGRAHPAVVFSLEPGRSDHLLLQPRGQAGAVVIELKGNIGGDAEIHVAELNYESRGFRTDKQSAMKALCFDPQREPCVSFFEKIEVESLEILAGADPVYFRMIYHKAGAPEGQPGGVLVCSPQSAAFSECVGRSSRISRAGMSVDIRREFGIEDYAFMPFEKANRSEGVIYARVRTDRGLQFFRIAFPIASSDSQTGTWSAKTTDYGYIASQAGLMALVVFPVAFDIVVFPYSIYYLLNGWGRAMGSP